MLSLNLIANDLREKNKARYFYDRAIKMLLLILIMLVLGGCVLYLIKGNYKYSLNMMSGQQDLLSEHDINNKLKESVKSYVFMEKLEINNSPWRDTLSELQTVAGNAITLTSIKIKAEDETVAIAGISRAQEDLSEFTDYLTNSARYHDVLMSVDFKIYKKNIPFSVAAKQNNASKNNLWP
jgi:hypothetical protein